MRQRFAGLESRFRENLGISKDRALTWIVDRGIFSLGMYQWVLENPNIYLITGEKCYQLDGWIDNYRDDHVWFRHLSQSGGIIEPLADGSVHRHLIGTADYPNPVRKVIAQVLIAFNVTAPR
ncbi:MAG: hypothetical protein R3F19_15330 [Verrucomicrobiales bacterium]